MKKTLFTLLSLCSLTACSLVHVHKMDVEQGNIMTQTDVNQLHVGMTVDQVKAIMGTPILMNTFNDNRLNYVYTFKPGYGTFTLHYVSLTFNKGILSEIQSNTANPLQ